MQIVSMTAEHVSRLAELEKLCFSEPWSEKSLTEEIDNPAACFLVAMQQDEVLGYGGMHTVLGESYVDNIAVFPEYRKKGYAKEACRAAIEYAEEEFGTVQFIVRIGKENIVSKKVAESLGFVRTE